MRDRYLSFDKKEMSLLEALELAACLPADRFCVELNGQVLSLRTRCFRTAECFRKAGHPDWVQFLGLVYTLGGIMILVDAECAAASEDDYDWTIPSQSRVVGCAAPDSVIFGEFRSLNADEHDPRYNTPTGMYGLHCGLDNVLLSWTGPEYMYFLLRHNHVDIPEEGLKMLRLASLSDWHTHNVYTHLVDLEDEEIQSFAADFDDLLAEALRQTLCGDELTQDECDGLWKAHYGDVVVKYNASGKLFW
jgi:inositol oxygenase